MYTYIYMHTYTHIYMCVCIYIGIDIDIDICIYMFGLTLHYATWTHGFFDTRRTIRGPFPLLGEVAVKVFCGY